MHVLKTTFAKIFRGGSRTYYYSSLFFPRDVRDDVFVLYSFVRTADDFVDQMPQDEVGFRRFRRHYNAALKGKHSDNEIITSFVELCRRRKFDLEWVEAFLDAMQSDLTKREYATIAELEKYMYGSAEVIGLFMAKILGLPQDTYPAAQMLGKSMQYINFLRDIAEDLSLGRTYIPREVLADYELTDLQPLTVRHAPEAFSRMMRHEVDRYFSWVTLGEAAFADIPRRYRIPIQTATDIYSWTARGLRRQPTVVYERKLKPSIPHVIAQVLYNTFTST